MDVERDSSHSVDAENGSEINLINPFKQAIDAIEKPS
jgi:hypothetical protein